MVTLEWLEGEKAPRLRWQDKMEKDFRGEWEAWLRTEEAKTSSTVEQLQEKEEDLV